MIKSISDSNMIIRDEVSQDVEAIDRLTKLAFEQSNYGYHNEALIIRQLRVDKMLTISLVAEQNGQVVGHIAFSPVEISDGTTDWYGLGPMAVLPDLQSQGIGSQLVFEGLTRLKELNAKGCVVLGDPNYYMKFGFKNDANLIFEGAPAEYFMNLNIEEHAPHGHVLYHKAFYMDE